MKHPNRVRRATGGWAAIAAAMLCPATILACDSVASCNADEIDAFFLPLIAASLIRDTELSGPAATASPAITSSIQPVVIKPPSSLPPSSLAPAIPVPALTARFQLTEGMLAAGGGIKLDIDRLTLATGQMDDGGGVAGSDMVRFPRFRRAASPAAVWEMQITDLLPAVPSWPLDGMVLPIDMQLTCGACGPGGRLHSFSGTAQFELVFDDGVTGWIDDIDLVAEDGLTATGRLNFTDMRVGEMIIGDYLADMFLKIGETETKLQGQLHAWMTNMLVVNGALAMVPVDGVSGIGAVAGHFSGAPCTDDCGVEN